MPPLPNSKIYLGSLSEPINCKSFTLNFTTNSNETMNAEQLARDIASLPEAHKTLDAVGPREGSIGYKVGVAVSALRSYRMRDSQDAIRHQIITFTHNQFSRVLPDNIGDVDERAARVVDELLKLREGSKRVITQECSLNTHRQLDRLQSAAPAEQLDLRVGILVDELLKLREENKKVISLECSRKTHEQLSRVCDNPWFASLDSRVSILVDELLKLRAQGEVNRSNLSDIDRHQMRAKMIAALNQSDIGNATPTVDMVDRLITAYKDLQLIAKPVCWNYVPVGGGRFRVMRGTEDATPHPVSEHVAQAICRDLNKQGV